MDNNTKNIENGRINLVEPLKHEDLEKMTIEQLENTILQIFKDIGDTDSLIRFYETTRMKSVPEEYRKKSCIAVLMALNLKCMEAKLEVLEEEQERRKKKKNKRKKKKRKFILK